MTTLPASMNGVKVQFENIYFEVLKANGHKIEKVLVRREALSEENESQNDNKNNK